MFWMAIFAAIPANIIVWICVAAIFSKTDLVAALFIVAHNVVVCTRIGAITLTVLAAFLLPTIFCTQLSRQRAAWLFFLSVPVILVLAYSWWFRLTGQEVVWP